MPGDHWISEEAQCGDAPGGPSLATILANGTRVERCIDGSWFTATVLDGYCEDGEVLYELEYADDGNRETEVPADELRVASGACPPVPASLPPDCAAPRAKQKSAPLGWESDETANPVAMLHRNGCGDDATATAFIVNGSETRIGAGGGLRGIRFLRESVNMR